MRCVRCAHDGRVVRSRFSHDVFRVALKQDPSASPLDAHDFTPHNLVQEAEPVPSCVVEGSFHFTAADPNDPSRTVTVDGTFTTKDSDD